MAKMNKKLADEVRSNLSAWYKYWYDNNKKYREMANFVRGEQWTREELSAFKHTRKEALTFNKLAPLVNNVIGEYIKATPNMQVVAVTNKPDDIADDIEINQDLFKTIAYSSDSKNVYRTAAKCAARAGYGVFYIDTEYEDERSFNQVIKLKEVRDPTYCFFDKHAKDRTKTDGSFCGRYMHMDRKVFDAKYPNLQMPANDTYLIEGLGKNWCDDDTVMVVYYFKRKQTPTTLHLLNDGEFGPYVFQGGEYTEQELKDAYPDIDKSLMPIVATRSSHITTIKRYKIAGEHILEETEWPCDELPLIFVDQESDELDGKQHTKALIEDAKDAQRFLNYVSSQIAYLTKKMRSEQWIGTDKMFNQHKAIWDNPDNVQGALRYTPDQQAPGGAPQQVAPAVISPVLFQQRADYLQDIHTSTGIFATQVGNEGNEISGVAISQRAWQGSTTTVGFFTNVNNAIAKAGQIILKMIPKIYDTHRIVAIQQSVGGMKSVEINKPDGYRLRNNVKDTKFVLSVDANMSFEAQKQQALASIIEVLRANPQVMMGGQAMPMFNLLGDMFVENLPLQNTVEMANRIRTIVPKEIIAAGKGEKTPPGQQQPNPQAMMMAQQQQMQMQAMQQEMAIKQKKVALQEAELQLKAAQQKLEEEKLGLERIETLANVAIAEGRQQTELLNSAIQATAHDHQHAHRMLDLTAKHVNNLQQPFRGQ